MTNHNPNFDSPAEVEKPEKEHTIEDDFPIENFKDNIIVLFKHAFHGEPVSLRIIGSGRLAEDIMKGGRHSVSGANGHTIVFNGNDVLWAECITAQENRDRAIAQARAQIAAQEAAEAKRAEEERAAREKAEAEARVKAAEAEAKDRMRPRGFPGWLRSRKP